VQRLSTCESDQFLAVENRNDYHLESFHHIEKDVNVMTDFNRSSTLSLRRSGTAALTAARATPARTSAPAQPRKHTEPATAQPSGPAAGDERALDSTALLQGRSHVSIKHNGETYQLRATRLGKLILTK
jgi:hemin uptake protein HemP